MKLLIIGKTGTGKSSLCNIVSGHKFDSDLFPVSSGPVSSTQTTLFGNIFFGGNKTRPVSLIDTIGFDDPTKDVDTAIIAELVTKLKLKCDHINLIGIAVNGQEPRLDASLIAMIKIFEDMFGEKFWKQCVLIFTKMPMDIKEKKRRIKNNGTTDEKLAEGYIKEVESCFPGASGLQYLCLDACYDTEDVMEDKAFKAAMEELFRMLQDAPQLPTNEMNENVFSKNGKLRRKIAEAEQKVKEVDGWMMVDR